MANQEHLGILHQGVDVWNNWREQHPTRPDLIKAELIFDHLMGVNFIGANLIKIQIGRIHTRRQTLPARHALNS